MVYSGYAHDRASRTPERASATPRLTRRWNALGLLLLVIVGGMQLSSSLVSPADALRGDLIRAASELERLPWNTSADRVRRTVAAAFGESVSVNPTGFPAYAEVTVEHVAHDTCVETLRLARRVEGRVVIALHGYRDVADCGADNDMTWRLMP